MRSVLEKHSVRRTSRLIRVRRLTAIPALSQRSYTTYAGGLSRSLFRLPEAVCDTPFKARSEARRNPLQRWVSIWIKLRHA